MISNSSKWSCEQCTYDNYARSLRCTLCNATRTNQLSPSPSTCEFSNDTRQSFEYQRSSTDEPSFVSVSPKHWTCSLCTYAGNWSHDIICVMCDAPRFNSSSNCSSSSKMSRAGSPGDARLRVSQLASPAGSTSLSSCICHMSDNVQTQTSFDACSMGFETSPIIDNNSSSFVLSIQQDYDDADTVDCVPMATNTANFDSISDLSALVSHTRNIRLSSPVVSNLSSISTLANAGCSSYLPDDILDEVSLATCHQMSYSYTNTYQHGISSEFLQRHHVDEDVENLQNNQLRNSWLHQKLNSLWYDACLAIIDGDIIPVAKYLEAGGDAKRCLTQHEVSLLDRPSCFQLGVSLIELALRFHRERILSLLFMHTESSHVELTTAPLPHSRLPCQPSSAQPPSNLARHALLAAVRRHKQPPGLHVCAPHNSMTFYLPDADILTLSPRAQSQLWTDLLDSRVRGPPAQVEGVEDCACAEVSWWPRRWSRLVALWNRGGAYTCVSDAVMQCVCASLDYDRCLLRLLQESLCASTDLFRRRWVAMLSRDSCDEWPPAECEQQLDALWLPHRGRHTSLQRLHIWVLCHLLRRPIIVYSLRLAHSRYLVDDERLQGVYLPFLWEASCCVKEPICLGHASNHICALVPLLHLSVQPDSVLTAHVDSDIVNSTRTLYYPLFCADGNPLPVHFLSEYEMMDQASILRGWLNVCLRQGCLLAESRITEMPASLTGMLRRWLDNYTDM